MAKNNKRNGAVELWGHQFKKVEQGLDKGEVESFVDELMQKYEALLKRTEHLSSLTKLAEKTIVEADSVAEQVRGEAEEKAKTEAKAIIAEAEEQAQKLIEEKRAEALAMVNREVEAIKAKAQQQAENMLEEKLKEIQPELRQSIKSHYGELLSQLENLKQQVATLEEELDQKLSQPPEKPSTVIEETSEAVIEEASEADGKASQADSELLELFQPASETGQDQPEWELEILPPIDLTQILDIINHLDSLPQVVRTELIPQMDKPTITVFLRQPIDLIDILKTLPQVANVTEDKTDPEGKTRKAQIELPRQIVTHQSN